MHVLFITGSYPPMKCGVGSYTQRLAKAIAKLENVKVTVLTDERASEAIDAEGIDVLPIMCGWRLVELSRVSKLIKHLNPDVVHIQYPTQGYSGRLAIRLPLLMRLLGKPCVQTWHEPILGKAGLWLATGLDVLVIVKEELIMHIPRLTRMAIFGTRTVWIPGASLLPTIILNDQECFEIRNQYTYNNEVLLAYFGFVAPLKGLESLFEVVANTTDMRLLLMCDFQPDNNYHRSLLNQIETLGIAPRVNITGFLPDEKLASILAASDAIVLPFIDGARAWNTSIDAAVAQGTFVLTTSLDGCEYNKQKNIYYAKPGNVEEMISAIQKYARQRASYKPSASAWQNIAQKHLSIYNKLVSE